MSTLGGALLLSLAGCPWVPADEHRRRRQALTETDPAPADTDVDADSDADVDTDTGPEPIPSCVDDAFEPNGTIPTATRATVLPGSFRGVICPEDLSPTFGLPLDLYEIEVRADQVLTAELDAAGETRCDQQTLGVRITDALGSPFDGAQGIGGCPSLSAGWGAGTYYVWVHGEQAEPAERYALDLALVSCADLDGDGFLAESCGGPDCSDQQPDRHPGAVELPADGIDQDCDGGDDLAPTCQAVTAGISAGTGQLGCGPLETGAVWDRWTLPIAAPGTDLSVVVQNDSGAADLLALVVDPDGTTHYGLETSRSQLDDEGDCASPAWTGEVTACPSACVEPLSAGAATIWIAQWPGTGCVADAGYRLLIYGDGTPIGATLAGDDVPLAFP